MCLVSFLRVDRVTHKSRMGSRMPSPNPLAAPGGQALNDPHIETTTITTLAICRLSSARLHKGRMRQGHHEYQLSQSTHSQDLARGWWLKQRPPCCCRRRSRRRDLRVFESWILGKRERGGRGGRRKVSRCGGEAFALEPPSTWRSGRGSTRTSLAACPPCRCYCWGCTARANVQIELSSLSTATFAGDVLGLTCS